MRMWGHGMDSDRGVLRLYVWACDESAGMPHRVRPTGMLRSPLYWTGMGLVGVLLLGLAFTERHVLRLDAIFIWAWFAAPAITVIALLIVRRALKWRYPV
jgi:hypothetical protein